MKKGLFAPAVNFLNRFKYPAKIGIISVILLLFIGGLTFLVIREINKKIDFVKSEKIGLEYIDPIKNFLQDTQQRRILTNNYLKGDKGLKYQILAKNKEIEKDIYFIKQAREKNNDVLKTNKIWNQINNEWINLEKKSLNLTPEENYKRHTDIITKTIDLIVYIGNVSNLLLSTQKDSFYLGYQVVIINPELTEEIEKARIIGSKIALSKKITAAEKTQLIVQKTLIEKSLSEINYNSLLIFNYNEVLKEKLEQFFDNTDNFVNHFLQYIDDKIINANEIIISPKDFYTVGTAAFDSSYRLYETELRNLEYLHQERFNKLEQQKNLLMTVLLVSFLLTIYILTGFVFALLASLNNLEKTALIVSQGNLDAKAEIYSNKDELGSFSVSFNNMIKNLKTLMERELILREIIISSLESRNINEILRNIVNNTGKLFNADRCFFVDYDFQKNEFFPVNPNGVYLSSLEFKNIIGRKFSNEETNLFTHIVYEQKQVLVVNDINKIIIPEATKAILKEFGIKSFMAAPLFYAGEPIGLLIVDSVKNLKKYTEEEQKLLETIANQSAIVINQAALTEKLQKTNENEILLRKIINNILESENPEKALNLICAEIGAIFDAERVKIRNYNTDEDLFSEVVTEYKKTEQIPSTFVKPSKYNKEMSEYFLNIFLKDKKLFIVEDVENSSIPRYVKDFCEDLSIKSVIIAPILYKDKFLATIIIENTTAPKLWEQEKLNLLLPVCQQIAIGINLFNLNEELKKALMNEKALREIAEEINEFKTYEEIDNYTLNQLLKVFNVERAIHFHFEKDSIFITNEKTSNENLVSLRNSWRFTKANLEEILTEPGLFIAINNTESEIKNGELKDYLRSQNINSFIIYPTIKMILKDKPVEVIEITMLANSINHSWSEYEKNLMKLIIDTISIISIKIIQKEEIEEIKRTFIATLTHDLRSPIIAEQKALEAMISKKINYLNENYEEYLEDIYKTNKELLIIVNNLLSVYHYESEKPLLNKEKTNIKALIEESVVSLKYLAADKESQIHIDISEDLPLIEIDRDEIIRVFSNLIGNSIKHTRKGTQIKINAVEKDGFIEFAIQDNGEGIPKENIDTIFQRYPVKKRKIGTGLGLYLSKQIIEAHNGKIWFETEEGIGTIFYFTLPV